jgi:hypothetical protein
MYCGGPLLGQYGGMYMRYIPNGYRVLGAVLGYGVRLRTRRCRVRFPVMAFPCNPLTNCFVYGSILLAAAFSSDHVLNPEARNDVPIHCYGLVRAAGLLAQGQKIKPTTSDSP